MTLFFREFFLQKAHRDENKADLQYVKAVLERGYSEIEAKNLLIAERTNWDAIGEMRTPEYIKGVIREAKGE